MNSKTDLQNVLKTYATHPDFVGINLVDVNQKGAVDDAPLHIAARKGDLDHINILVRHGADVNQPGDLGNTPLHFASMAGKVDAVKLLLLLGAHRNVANEFNQKPIDVAELGGNIKVTAILRK